MVVFYLPVWCLFVQPGLGGLAQGPLLCHSSTTLANGFLTDSLFPAQFTPGVLVI